VINWVRGQLTALGNPERGRAPPEADYICTPQLEFHAPSEYKPPPDIQLPRATTSSNIIASDDITEALFLRLGDCTRLLGRMVEWSHEDGEYPRKLGKRTGAAAEVFGIIASTYGILESLLPARQETKGASHLCTALV